jgi:hypothetical protein
VLGERRYKPQFDQLEGSGARAGAGVSLARRHGRLDKNTARPPNGRPGRGPANRSARTIDKLAIQSGRAYMYCMDAPSRECLRSRPMAGPFEAREHWRDVSRLEFEAFLRRYPRPLEARPPLSRKARYREWVVPALGKWSGNAVAKCWTRGRCTGFQIRDYCD